MEVSDGSLGSFTALGEASDEFNSSAAMMTGVGKTESVGRERHHGGQKVADSVVSTMSMPEDLALATAAVVQEAGLKRSDSVLTETSELGDTSSSAEPTHRRGNSNVYMEEASIEAVNRVGKAKLITADSSQRNMSLPVRCSTASAMSEMSQHGYAEKVSIDNRRRNSLDQRGDAINGKEEEEDMSPRSVVEILPAAPGVLTVSLDDLRNLWRHSEDYLVQTLRRVRDGEDTALEDSTAAFSYNIRRSSMSPAVEVLLLHSMFCTFCSPPPSLAQVTNVLASEQANLRMDWKEASRMRSQRRKRQTSTSSDGHNHELPSEPNVVVALPHKAPVINLLVRQPQKYLLRLPAHFQLAFFRILIRLLTNETDDEYNEECLLACEWWEREEAADDSMAYESGKGHDSLSSSARDSTNLGSLQELETEDDNEGDEHPPEFPVFHKPDETPAKRKRRALDRHKKQQSWLRDKMKRSTNRIKATKRRNLMYAMVRFRVSWDGSTSGGENPAVWHVLQLFELVLAKDSHHHLLAPVARLLGLLSSAGISVKEFRRILELSGRDIPGEGAPLQRCGLDRLLLVRALTTAADGASTSSFLVGKASPPHFFSYRRGEGLTRDIKSLSAWPFRNDFGMAVWFRAEKFQEGSSEHSVLLSVRTPDGGGIEVTLVPLDGDSSATVIAVTSYDSNYQEDEKKRVSRVLLKGCILLPRVWYHVAVRLTRSRLKGVFSLAARQQLSILLDGKVMTTDDLRFPEITYSEPDSSSSSNGLLGLRRSHNTVSVKVEFASKFEGQTGALYLFNDNVASATLRALMEVTAGTNGLAKQERLEDHNWDSLRRDNARRASVVEIASVDAEEIAMTNSRTRDKRRLSTSDSIIVDLGEGDGQEQGSDFPAELAYASLGSKLWLVWDPKRTEAGVALDLHAGAHVNMDPDKVQPWFVEGARNVVASIGGIQALLPIYERLLSGKIEENMLQIDNESFDWRIVFQIIPNLISLLSAFLRDHDENAREILRCGGIDIVEHWLLGNRTKLSDTDDDRVSLIGSLAVYQGLAVQVVESLLELRLVCSQYDTLETTIFSRLFFNMPLWFGEDPNFVGASLHATLLPLLASVACTSPKKVRDCVGVRRLVESMKPYTDYGATMTTLPPDPETDLFDRRRGSKLRRLSTLTENERRHVVDIIMGIVCTVLAQGTPAQQLGSILNYISYNVDFEWEQASKDVTDGRDPSVRTGKRAERHRATVRACAVLVFLLRGRPVLPGLLKSLEDCIGGRQDVASWILCALINSYDDEIRSFGIRCFVDYLDLIEESPEAPARSSIANAVSASEGRNRISVSLVSTVGKGLASIGTGGVLSNVITHSEAPNITVLYKLLWHLLKLHRMRLGVNTNSALLNMLLKDRGVVYESRLLVQDVVVMDEVLHTGYRFDLVAALNLLVESDKISHRKLRETPGLSMILRLLRFLSDKWKEEWLVDLVDMASNVEQNLELLASSDEWQSSLFHLISDTLEEMQHSSGKATRESQAENRSDEDETNGVEENMVLKIENGEKADSSPEMRFDLSLRLYCLLLAHNFRQGGEKALATVEQTASLQRVCVNGPEILILILNHLLAELIEHGTVADSSDVVVPPGVETKEDRSRMLKDSARVVTSAIMANRSDGQNASSAVKQWRSLRHLASIASAMVIKNGFTLVRLLSEDAQFPLTLDGPTGGVFGMRLSEHNVKSVCSSEYLKMIEMPVRNGAMVQGMPSGRVALAVAAQTLSVLDAFIFPETLDASSKASQLHGLALVRSNDSRLGVAQGPLLASLVRLSLILLTQIEPCSVKYLQCCSRLRCFIHWSLELIRESVALAGYSAVFHELTAPLDRLILATVLHCQSALSRCSLLVDSIENSEHDYFGQDEARKKNHKRLLRIAYELREITLACFSGRIEVFRTSLQSEAFEELQASLEQPGSSDRRGSVSKETIVRAFLSSRWVPDTVGGFMSRICSTRGKEALSELDQEAAMIGADFDHALDSSFNVYCEDQRKWAETDAVRDIEYDGDLRFKQLSTKHKTAVAETKTALSLRANNALNRWHAVERSALDPWNSGECQWSLPPTTDRLNRRILLTRNYTFNDHAEASYELMLGLERERAHREREEKREKKAKAKELWDLVQRNSTAFNPQGGSDLEVAFDNEALPPEDLEFEEDQHDAMSETGSKYSDGVLSQDSVDGIELLDESKPDEDGWAKMFIWSDTETVVARFTSVMMVTLQAITEGKILLTTHGIYFKQTGNVINVMTKEMDQEEKQGDYHDQRWRLSRLTEVHGRRFMLRAQAIELFFSDSHELFLNFGDGARDRDRFYAKIRNSCQVPMLWSPKSLNPRVVFKKSKLSQLWRKGVISNFEYLMQINKMAGRTFNDITQYPVFPWVLADYTSESIDLSDSRVFRDLTKPVGALNENRLAGLIERYNDLVAFGFSEKEKFLYGSHYSSPGVVLHYLIRQEPFTTMAIELQSGRFDCPDRLFFDIAGCWRSCNTSTSDVKELVPELFTCPEVFLNTNGFPLGHTQDERSIENVGLPPWAKGSAYEFVRIHRLALESDYVSEHLNHWIDLIFGYKQRGAQAEAAHNVFHYLSYEGAVDLDKITDEVDRKATESHIQNFGQTPSQLLTKESHPSRFSSHVRWSPLIHQEDVAEHLRFHTPSNQFGGNKKSNAKGAALSIHVLSDIVVVIYADMSVGTYKFSASRGSKSPFSFKLDRHKVFGRKELSCSRQAIKRGSAAPKGMESSKSHLSVGSQSFGLTIGGEARESIRRKAHQSRLTSAKESLSTAELNASIVSCGYWDDTVKVHTVDGLKLTCSDTGGHRGPVRCLALGDDGALMVTGGNDATCRVWVVDHPDMAVALSDGYVKTALGEALNREKTLICCHVLWGHVAPITCVSLSSDLDVSVSGSLDGAVCVHTVRRGSYVRTVRPFNRTNSTNAARKIALDGTGSFCVAMEDHTLHTYTVNSVHLASIDAGEAMNDMFITSFGNVLVTGGELGWIVCRTVRDLLVLSVLDLSRQGPIRCLSLTPDDLNPTPQFLFVGSDDGTVTIVDEDPQSAERSETVEFSK